MGNSFVLFDVSIVISHGQFHCGNRGHTQNTDFPWVKSHFPVRKRSSGTAANVGVHHRNTSENKNTKRSTDYWTKGLAKLGNIRSIYTGENKTRLM